MRSTLRWAFLAGGILGLVDGLFGLSNSGLNLNNGLGLLAIIGLHQLLALLLAFGVHVLLNPDRTALVAWFEELWARRRGGAEEFGRSLGLLVFLVAVPGAVAVSVYGVISLAGAFKTPFYVATFQAAVCLLTMTLAWVLIRRLQVWIGGFELAAPISRFRILALGLALATSAYLFLWLNRDLLFKEINPWLPLCLSFHALAALAALLLPRHGQSLRNLAVHIALAVALAFGLGSGSSARSMVVGGAPAGSLVASWIRALSDFDRDGVAGLVGGGDCAPFDGAIFPGAVDLPDDGIDQDCLAGDLSEAVIVPRSKPVFAPVSKKDRSQLVVLVSVDALRADRLGSYGYRRHPTSPHLDRWAKKAAVFEKAFTSGPYTIAAIPGLLTSRGISQIPNYVATKGSYRLDPDLETIAEPLREDGFKTAAVLTGLDNDTNDFAQGIDDLFVISKKYIDSAEETVATARTWLSKHPVGKRFLWLHFFDPHDPYLVMPGFDFGNSSSARYDASIAYMDKHLGPFLEEISSQPFSTVVLVSDHGEAFGEHGAHHHGQDLYMPNVHIPMIIRGHGVQPRRLKAAVSILDVMPTLVNLTGLRPRDAFGQSLVPLLRGGEEEPSRGVLTESYRVGQIFAWSTAQFRLIYRLHANHFELYDIDKDPGEMNNLYRPGTEPSDSLTRQLLEAMNQGVYVRRGLRVKEMMVDEVPKEYRLPRPQRFGDLLQLHGWRFWLAGKPGKPEYFLDLYFTADRRPEKPWRVALGLRNGKKVRNKDHVPGRGYFPFNKWPPNLMVKNKVVVGRMSGMPAGDYEITLGFYHGRDRLLPEKGGPFAHSSTGTRVILGTVKGIRPQRWQKLKPKRRQAKPAQADGKAVETPGRPVLDVPATVEPKP